MRSVIVRLFEPAPGTGPVGLCGIVEDVRTGARWQFRGDDQLLAALAQATGDRGGETEPENVAENRWS